MNLLQAFPFTPLSESATGAHPDREGDVGRGVRVEEEGRGGQDGGQGGGAAHIGPRQGGHLRDAAPPPPQMPRKDHGKGQPKCCK